MRAGTIQVLLFVNIVPIMHHLWKYIWQCSFLVRETGTEHACLSVGSILCANFVLLESMIVQSPHASTSAQPSKLVLFAPSLSTAINKDFFRGITGSISETPLKKMLAVHFSDLFWEGSIICNIYNCTTLPLNTHLWQIVHISYMSKSAPIGLASHLKQISSLLKSSKFHMTKLIYIIFFFFRYLQQLLLSVPAFYNGSIWPETIDSINKILDKNTSADISPQCKHFKTAKLTIFHKLDA